MSSVGSSGNSTGLRALIAVHAPSIQRGAPRVVCCTYEVTVGASRASAATSVATGPTIRTAVSSVVAIAARFGPIVEDRRA
jgi:hypothetical protein